MKLLMVTHYFDSHRSGIEIVAGRLFQGLAEHPCEITWAAADVTSPPRSDSSRKILPLKSWNGLEEITGLPVPVPYPGAFAKLLACVTQADVVLIHDCLYLSNVAAFVRARLRGIPVIIIQHIGFIPYRSLALRLVMKACNALVVRRMLSTAQQVVFISQNTARYFASVRFRKPPLLVFNGVDTETFRPPEDEQCKASLRRQLGLPASGRVVLFVGRFVEKKGISALRIMSELRVGWTWVFVGSGALDPAAWGAANVRVFSSLAPASMSMFYRACDVLVLPSVGEGLPLVIQEAMASGLPIVCGIETLEADEGLKAYVRGAAVYVGEDGRTAQGFLSTIDETFASEGAGGDRSRRRREYSIAQYSWKRGIDTYWEIASRLAGVRTEKDQVGIGEGARP